MCIVLMYWTQLAIQATYTTKLNFTIVQVNPLSTTDLLTLYLIGPYHEMFICLAKIMKSL